MLVTVSTGQVWGWGCNVHGQLGLGDDADRVFPEHIVRLKSHRVVQPVAGWRHSMVLTDESKMFGWGMFGAINKSLPKDRHDPDADNTQFESQIPLEVPFNGAGARRTPRAIAAGFSKTISVSALTYHQKAVSRDVARKPVMSPSMRSVQEAEHLLTDGRGPPIDDEKRADADTSIAVSKASEKLIGGNIDSMSEEQLRLVKAMQVKLVQSGVGVEEITSAGRIAYPIRPAAKSPPRGLIGQTVGEHSKNYLHRGKAGNLVDLARKKHGIPFMAPRRRSAAPCHQVERRAPGSSRVVTYGVERENRAAQV